MTKLHFRMKRRNKESMTPFKKHNISKRNKKRKKQVLKVMKRRNKKSKLSKFKSPLKRLNQMLLQFFKNNLYKQILFPQKTNSKVYSKNDFYF